MALTYPVVDPWRQVNDDMFMTPGVDEVEPLALVGAAVWRHDVKLDVSFRDSPNAIQSESGVLTDLSPIYLLHGPNGWGKTTLLQAIRNASDALVGELNPLPPDQFDASLLRFHDDTEVFTQRFAGLVRVGVTAPGTISFEDVPCTSSQRHQGWRGCEATTSETCRHFLALTYGEHQIQQLRLIANLNGNRTKRARADDADRFGQALEIMLSSGQLISPFEIGSGISDSSSLVTYIEGLIGEHIPAQVGLASDSTGAARRVVAANAPYMGCPFTREHHVGPFAGLERIFSNTRGDDIFGAADSAEFAGLTISLLGATARRFEAHVEDAHRLERRRIEPGRLADALERSGAVVDEREIIIRGSFEDGKRQVRDAIIKAGADVRTASLLPPILGLALPGAPAPALRSINHVTDLIMEFRDLEERLLEFGFTSADHNDLLDKVAKHLNEISIERLTEIAIVLEHEIETLKPIGTLLGKLELFTEFVDAGLRKGAYAVVNDTVGFEIRRYAEENDDHYEVIEPWQLSSGNQQRVSLALTTLFETPHGSTLLIDEPELSLDVRWQRTLVDDLHYMARTSDLTLILATHSPLVTADHVDLLVPRIDGESPEVVE